MMQDDDYSSRSVVLLDTTIQPLAPDVRQTGATNTHQKTAHTCLLLLAVDIIDTALSDSASSVECAQSALVVPALIGQRSVREPFRGNSLDWPTIATICPGRRENRNEKKISFCILRRPSLATPHTRRQTNRKRGTKRNTRAQ